MPCESLWVALAYPHGDGNGYRDGNSNDDSSSVAHAYSDGATTDNTYTTAPSNAAAAPVTRLQPLDAGTRESLREFLQGVISLLPKFRMQCFGVRQFPAAVRANADLKQKLIAGGTRCPRSFCRGSRVGCNDLDFAGGTPAATVTLDRS